MLRKTIRRITEVKTGKLVYESSDSYLANAYIRNYCYKVKGKLYRLLDDAELKKETIIVDVNITEKEG